MLGRPAGCHHHGFARDRDAVGAAREYPVAVVVGRRPSLVLDIGALILATRRILFAHRVEVLPRAGFLYWKHAFVNASTSYYYSLNQYSAVGSSLGLPSAGGCWKA